jgi:hypothetical protein
MMKGTEPIISITEKRIRETENISLKFIVKIEGVKLTEFWLVEILGLRGKLFSDSYLLSNLYF